VEYSELVSELEAGKLSPEEREEVARAKRYVLADMIMPDRLRKKIREMWEHSRPETCIRLLKDGSCEMLSARAFHERVSCPFYRLQTDPHECERYVGEPIRRSQ